MKSMKILFASSEAVPFVASGGLAEVAGSLSKALRNRMLACRVVIPLYGDISQKQRDNMRFVASFNVPLGWRNQYCGIFETTVDGVKYYLLDNEYYFRRSGLYGFYDDAERFAFFSKAVTEMLGHIDFAPDIIHCNDWQTAMIPVYLNLFYRNLEKYRDIRTVFTIHNIQYQGEYGMEIAQDVLGLPPSANSIVYYCRNLNIMKGAIEQCDAVTTVSPTYAKEILEPYYAHGMDRILREKQYKLSGILNGIDYTVYNPQTDENIFENFSAEDFSKRAENKRLLQKLLGLREDPDTMVIGVVSRLVGHKGMDLIQYILNDLMADNVQLVVLGSGETTYERFFQEMQHRYPERISVTIAFVPHLARKIYAGADVFLMPSKSEPCGLAQMIALRYGAIPVVRLTGGLADSIVDLGEEEGNGYTFLSYNAHDMLGAIRRAEGAFANKPYWEEVVGHAMTCDFSWKRSAGEYINLYKKILGR